MKSEKHKKADEVCAKVRDYCIKGWPEYMPHNPILKNYFEQRGHLSVVDDLLIYEKDCIRQWPQFANENLRELAEENGFVYTTSSQRYQEANGEAEREFRTVKALLKKNHDINLALLSYRVSPLQNGLAPSELLMGRKLKTQVPVLPHTLLPQLQQQDLKSVREKEEKYRSDQMMTYNRRHDSRELPELQPGDLVWIHDQSRYGRVIQKAIQPRSYHVQTEHGTIRRNRKALISIQDQAKTTVPDPSSDVPTSPDDPDGEPDTLQPTQQTGPSQQGASPTRGMTETRTRSGRLVKPPNRLSL
nr:uncharacterized protein LOC129283335 [Lytechinus pictus]